MKVVKIFSKLMDTSVKRKLPAGLKVLIHTQLLKHCRENILMGVHLIL